MQPESILRDTYRDIVGNVEDVVAAALAPRPQIADENAYYRETVNTAPEAIQTVASAWASSEKALREIDAAIDQFGEGVVRIQSDGDLNDEAKARLASELHDATSAYISEREAIVLSGIDEVLTGLRAASFPARPTPLDAAQEARLAGLKSDFQMVAQAASDDDAVDVLRGLLERSIGDGDDLAVWLLASSRWPADYLASRIVGGHAAATGSELANGVVANWNAEVSEVLERSPLPTEVKEVRAAYDKVSHGRYGLPAVRAAVASLLPQVLTEVGGWTLSAR